MVNRFKPSLSDSLAACLGSMNYWDNNVATYMFERRNIQDWTNQYIKTFYQLLVNRALGQLKTVNPRVLKVDLWNEGVETSRDILSGFTAEDAVGFDFSKTICRLAKHRLENTNVAQATCHSLPFKSEKFDLILDLSTIDHIPFKDVNLIFHEYYRVLKQGGLLAVAFWRQNVVTKYFIHTPPDQFYFDKKKIAQELQNNGFQIINSYDIGSLLTITENNLWLGPFLFWRLKTAFEEHLLNSVAKFEQYVLNMMGGLHVFYARHP
ncbi:MAG: class I SAM-dependent methyltransferase [Candidatus Bathyarchaeia archaeon]|jgi:SAM-dependent methyltransferase